jgi:predicted transcriptional regulator
MNADDGSSGGPRSEHPVFESLDDADCRAILRETSQPRTAAQLAGTCDIASSTLYRKLDRLIRATLVRKRETNGPDGGRVTRFERDFDGITITMDNDGLSVDITRS